MNRYSAKDLAGLPGMPQSVSGVIRKATSQGWEAQKRMGRGGGREYPVAALPLETRVALMDRESRAALAASAQALSDLADRHQALAENFRRLGKALGQGGHL